MPKNTIGVRWRGSRFEKTAGPILWDWSLSYSSAKERGAISKIKRYRTSLAVADNLTCREDTDRSTKLATVDEFQKPKQPTTVLEKKQTTTVTHVRRRVIDFVVIGLETNPQLGIVITPRDVVVTTTITTIANWIIPATKVKVKTIIVTNLQLSIDIAIVMKVRNMITEDIT